MIIYNIKNNINRLLDKIRIAIVAGFVAILMSTLPAKAGFFSDFKDALIGHTKDIKGRFSDGEVLTYDNIHKSGVFDETAIGQDLAHYAKGKAELVELNNKLYIQLTESFTSGPLPDGHVYISKDVDTNEEKDFNFNTQIDLGELIKSNGAGFYEIPSGISINDINSVTIWCKRFSAYIGSADLKIVNKK